MYYKAKREPCQPLRSVFLPIDCDGHKSLEKDDGTPCVKGIRDGQGREQGVQGPYGQDRAKDDHGDAQDEHQDHGGPGIVHINLQSQWCVRHRSGGRCIGLGNDRSLRYHNDECMGSHHGSMVPRLLGGPSCTDHHSCGIPRYQSLDRSLRSHSCTCGLQPALDRILGIGGMCL